MQQIQLKIFKQFFRATSSSGFILFAGVVTALVIANTQLAAPFQSLLDAELGYRSGYLQLRYPVQLWVNDGLMAVFFLMVGLEIKRELTKGELSTPKKALLPVLCALGGAATPAFIYFLFNKNLPTASGWGIPMATDIAFALAIISALSNRVPAALKIFLAALAIADDLMAIIVIAVFYAGELHLDYLLYAVGVAGLLFLLNRLKVVKLICYLIPGLLLWYFIHHSGVHATIAGVVTALFIPVAGATGMSPLERLEHLLAKPVNYLIVPLFALSNTNITFQEGMLAALASPLGLGIVIGLVFGKPAGVLLVAWVGVKTRLCELPEKAGWRHLAGAGLLAGIGFTMSIFMALLSFVDPSLIAEAKFAVLSASVVAAVLGYMVLGRRS